MRTEVETELAFFKKKVEVETRDSVIFSEDALGLVPEVFDAVDGIASVGKSLGMIDADLTP